MSTFQIVVLGIFSTLILVGVGTFALFGGLLGGKSSGPVTIWGTMDDQIMEGVIDAMRSQDKTLESVTYVEKREATYKTDLVNAMAAGQGPDLFLLPAEDILLFSDKIATIPYSVFAQGSYLASYVDQAQLFLTPDGELALPLTIDPIVMYWNRDLFASAGLATPPTHWNDFLALSPKMTSLDNRSSVKRSAVALGEWRNIANAKEMLSILFMQAGDNIVVRANNGAPVVVLGSTPQDGVTNPAESALRFYTEFANPSKTSYSWNRSLPEAKQMFTAGNLGVYFGYASEYADIAERNPNLRFSVAMTPQIESSNIRVTYGHIVGLAISRSARNIQGALLVAQTLSGKDAVGLIAGALSLPPVRRDVIVDTSGSAIAAVFVNSSYIARGWLDPSPTGSNSIFQTMIESVVSGELTPSSAVREGSAGLQQLLPRQQ